MNILIINGYVRQNKGDAALMSVLCHELRLTFPDATIEISSQENPQQYPTFEDCQNVGSFIRYCFDPAAGKISHLYRALLSIFLCLVLFSGPPKLRLLLARHAPVALRAQLNALIKADLVISMGGGYLNGNKSLMADICVFFMIAPLILAKRLGACAICAPQSMGPFGTRFQRTIVTRALENIDLILTRERKTDALLGKLSKNFPLVPSADSGFLFKAEATHELRSQLHVSNDDLLVGVTVRRWLDSTQQQRYEQAVAKTIDYLISQHNATVVLIPQVTSALGGDDDRITSQSVRQKTARSEKVVVLTEEYSHHQIKTLYNSLDAIIGTRFHSVIFSLTSFVPALAIEYEHKTSGIMHELGLDRWVIRIEDVTARKLIDKIDELICVRDSYKTRLEQILPAYIATAQDATEYIAQAYKKD